jgi:uncharacterized membrane protein YdfJ with MMPL/SSD domain
MGATMRPLFLLAALAMVGLSWACAPVLDAGTTDLAQGDAGAAADAGALDAGVIAGSLAELTVALRGDFDNAAQVAASGVKRVERHVCSIPGRDQTADLAWLYVEHVEDLATGASTRAQSTGSLGNAPRMPCASFSARADRRSLLRVRVEVHDVLRLRKAQEMERSASHEWPVRARLR